MDQSTEQAVWRRVKGPEPMTAEEALLPERLEALIQEQRGDGALLEALSRRMGGGQGTRLRSMAAGTGSRVRELTTLHYLLTGRRLRPRPAGPPPRGPVTELLRTAALRARQAAAAYRALGGEFQSWQEDLSRMARASETQARALTALLRQRLQQSEWENPGKKSPIG